MESNQDNLKLTEWENISYSDFFNFYYCVRDLKDHGFKLDFNYNYGFKILRRSDEKEIIIAYSVNALKAFLSALNEVKTI